MERVALNPDPEGLGFLTPSAFDALLALTRDIHRLADDLTTAKFPWHWNGMAQAFDWIILRLDQAPDGPSAGLALNDLYILLTDEARWH